MTSSNNLNCLSHWYPKIRDVVPTPKTVILKTQMDLSGIVEDVLPEGFYGLVEAIQNAGDSVGWPFFLRTGQGSGKHEWSRTCFVRDREHVQFHVGALVEWSMMVDLPGLPTNVWVIREMLPTKPVAVLPAYRHMPLCREFRCFVKDGELQCIHPYWPKQAAEEGFGYRDRVLPDGWEQAYEELCSLKDFERYIVEELAKLAGKAIGGSWSIDILDTERGWFVTDMAEAHRSFHWPGCQSVAE